MPVKIFALTLLAMVAFAANSVICRLALGTNAIDPGSFTTIRLLSGAIALLTIAACRNTVASSFRAGDWFSALTLFVYAAGFSFAYVTLSTGTGALILFSAVQITMIAYSIFNGSYPRFIECLGLLLALFGFVYLVLPGISTPALPGFILMSLAGISWGVYTLRGKRSTNPLASTTGNFILSIPLVVILYLFISNRSHFSFYGTALAALSGAASSGLGYALWYAILPRLSVTEAAIIQLSAPLIATLGGILFMSEVLTWRLGIAALAILGGILVVILGRHYRSIRSA